MIRIGQGIDFHRLAEGEPFWLGGVQVDHHAGAVGHSDADVLLHAICDALLGALALGDIGVHFPNTSEEFRGISSKILLKRTVEKIWDKGYRVVNVDATLCLEEPKIKPYIEQMQLVISSVLRTALNDVSIKATTTEKLGFVGREEGVAAMAIALLQRNIEDV
jgi:2-C-methyl-D-erythritol 2,4-cyclodiphosphate synthase